MEWVTHFLKYTDKNIQFFTVCTVLLTFDDITLRLINEKVVHIHICSMQSGRSHYTDTDITGVTLEQVMKKTVVNVKVLPKVGTRFANE